MEHTDPRPTLSDGAPGPERQLPDGANKVERLARETRGLIDDVKDWVDLKIQLVQMEVEERVEQKLNQALLGAMLVVVAFLALVFALTALALGLGSWLGHDAWGFLAVTGLLALVAVALRLLKPRMVRMRDEKRPSKDGKPSASQALTKTNP
ncbi:phage holin family protein [Rhodocaloribacter sp.]|jgi:hypothetical protein